jgi:hypothetical protein
MEDTLFSFILFVGFYCLYSKMFAPNLNDTTDVTQVSTVPTAAAVKAVAPLTTDRATATRATNHNSVKSEQQTAELAPDRDRDSMTIAFNQPTGVSSRQTATSAATTRNTRSKQPDQPRAIAQSKTS